MKTAYLSFVAAALLLAPVFAVPGARKPAPTLATKPAKAPAKIPGKVSETTVRYNEGYDEDYNPNLDPNWEGAGPIVAGQKKTIIINGRPVTIESVKRAKRDGRGFSCRAASNRARQLLEALLNVDYCCEFLTSEGYNPDLCKRFSGWGDVDGWQSRATEQPSLRKVTVTIWKPTEGPEDPWGHTMSATYGDTKTKIETERRSVSVDDEDSTDEEHGGAGLETRSDPQFSCPEAKAVAEHLTKILMDYNYCRSVIPQPGVPPLDCDKISGWSDVPGVTVVASEDVKKKRVTVYVVDTETGSKLWKAQAELPYTIPKVSRATEDETFPIIGGPGPVIFTGLKPAQTGTSDPTNEIQDTDADYLHDIIRYPGSDWRRSWRD
jgi:hypothetical protein